MQYPPQEQAPSSTPSEVYMPEQPQAYPLQQQVYAPQYPSAMPGQEITQPPMLGQVIMQPFVPGQEIVIYPNRTQAILRTTMCGIGLGLLVLMLVGMLLLLNLTIDRPWQASDIGPLGALLAFYLSVIAFAGWITWDMAQLLKRTPLLTINRQGIAVGKMPMLSGFFIPWNEIEEIYAYTFIYRYLCIRPKNAKQFMKRFNILERGIRYSNVMFGVPPLIAPQVFLEQPVDVILQQLYYGYASELNYYRIQFRP